MPKHVEYLGSEVVGDSVPIVALHGMLGVNRILYCSQYPVHAILLVELGFFRTADASANAFVLSAWRNNNRTLTGILVRNSWPGKTPRTLGDFRDAVLPAASTSRLGAGKLQNVAC